jgi:hypothetical protein
MRLTNRFSCKDVSLLTYYLSTLDWSQFSLTMPSVGDRIYLGVGVVGKTFLGRQICHQKREVATFIAWRRIWANSFTFDARCWMDGRSRSGHQGFLSRTFLAPAKKTKFACPLSSTLHGTLLSLCQLLQEHLILLLLVSSFFSLDAERCRKNSFRRLLSANYGIRL